MTQLIDKTECPVHDFRERQIAAAVVDCALKAGFLVTINNGEDDEIVRSADRAAILKAMAATDEDYVILHTPKGVRFGFVWLIYGNGTDLISDYGGPDLDAIDALLKPADALADKLAA